MKVPSNLRPHDYSTNEVVRILNPKQQLLYIKSGIYPIDIYCSIDGKTGNNVIVMIFSREESSEVYQKWLNHELE